MIRKVGDILARIVLSCFVLGLLGVCSAIFLGSSFNRDFSAPEKGGKREARSWKKPAASRVVSTVWPHFPASSQVRAHELAINGIHYTTESWETCSLPEIVLNYYKCQMAARGWTDVTEESYNLKPEFRLEKSGDGGLQDQQYVDLYRKVTGTCLALKRGSWSMHVGAEAIPDRAGWSRVTLCSAETPSIKEFADPWVSTHREAGRLQPRELDVVEHSGDQRYRTKITHRDQTPTRAFDDAFTTLKKENWRPMVAIPSPKDQQGGAALLVRGEQYGALVVTPESKGTGASVAWTEVTPDGL